MYARRTLNKIDREILTAGRECYASLSLALELLEKDKTTRIPRRIKQALDRSKPILFGPQTK